MPWKLQTWAAAKAPTHVKLNRTGTTFRKVPFKETLSHYCRCWLKTYLINLLLVVQVRTGQTLMRRRGEDGNVIQRRVRSHLEVSVYYTLLMAILHR